MSGKCVEFRRQPYSGGTVLPYPMRHGTTCIRRKFNSRFCSMHVSQSHEKQDMGETPNIPQSESSCIASRQFCWYGFPRSGITIIAGLSLAKCGAKFQNRHNHSEDLKQCDVLLIHTFWDYSEGVVRCGKPTISGSEYHGFIQSS